MGKNDARGQPKAISLDFRSLFEGETVALPPAGWYFDPESSATMRWWSGEEWTEHQQPLATASPTAQSQLTGRVARLENARQLRLSNAFAWLGLLVAGVSVIVNPLGIFSMIAVVFGSIGLARANRLRDGGTPVTGRGAAIAGLVVGLVTLMIFGAVLLTGRTAIG